MRLYLYMAMVRAHRDIFGAVVVAAAIISFYSFWGAHILAGNPEAPVASAEQNLR